MTKTLFKLRNLTILPMLALSALAFGGCNLVDIEITSPANGAEVVVGEPVTIEVSIAGERAPEVREVAFYRLVTNSNAVLLSRDTRAPYQATWTPSASNLGPIVLQAVATDTDGKNLGLTFSEVTVVEADGPTPPNGSVASLVGSVEVPGGFLATDELGSVAVLSSQASGITVVDLSTPAQPRITGTLDLVHDELGVATDGAFAFVVERSANRERSSLAIVDIRVPGSPSLAGRLELPGIASGGAIDLDGSLAYVKATSAGLHIIDISNPVAPRIIGNAALTRAASRVDAEGGVVALSSFNTLSMVDARDPQRPTETKWGLWEVHAMAVSSDKRLVFSSDTRTNVFDVSNPSALKGLGSMRVGAKALAIVNDYVFMATSPGVRVVDISDPTAPLIVSEISMAEVRSAVAGGNLVLALDASKRLHVLQLNR